MPVRVPTIEINSTGSVVNEAIPKLTGEHNGEDEDLSRYDLHLKSDGPQGGEWFTLGNLRSLRDACVEGINNNKIIDCLNLDVGLLEFAADVDPRNAVQGAPTITQIGGFIQDIFPIEEVLSPKKSWNLKLRGVDNRLGLLTQLLQSFPDLQILSLLSLEQVQFHGTPQEMQQLADALSRLQICGFQILGSEAIENSLQPILATLGNMDCLYVVCLGSGLDWSQFQDDLPGVYQSVKCLFICLEANAGRQTKAQNQKSLRCLIGSLKTNDTIEDVCLCCRGYNTDAEAIREWKNESEEIKSMLKDNYTITKLNLLSQPVPNFLGDDAATIKLYLSLNGRKNLMDPNATTEDLTNCLIKANRRYKSSSSTTTTAAELEKEHVSALFFLLSRQPDLYANTATIVNATRLHSLLGKRKSLGYSI